MLLFSQVAAVFQTMFEIDESYGEIKINEAFKAKVQKWLNNDPTLTGQVLKQVITHSLSSCPINASSSHIFRLLW